MNAKLKKGLKVSISSLADRRAYSFILIIK